VSGSEWAAKPPQIQAVLAAPLVLLITIAIIITIYTAHSEHHLPYRSIYLLVDLLLVTLPLQGVATLAAGRASFELSYGGWILAFVFLSLAVRSILTVAAAHEAKDASDESLAVANEAKKYAKKLLLFHLLGFLFGIAAATWPKWLILIELIGIFLTLVYMCLWGLGLRLRIDLESRATPSGS